MTDFVELRCLTHYSFLRGASHPRELIDRAIELGLKGLAISDLNGVYGLPKAYLAAKAQAEINASGFKLISGAQLKISEFSWITLLACNRQGYGLICRILSAAHHGKSKGEAFLFWNEFLAFFKPSEFKEEVKNIVVLPSGQDWPWEKLKEVFGSQVYFSLCRHLNTEDSVNAGHTQFALDLLKIWGIEFIATNDVYYHAPERAHLQDVLTCIREGITLEESGFQLFSNQERYLKSPEQMRRLFSDLPEAISNTVKIADQCQFSLSELKYRYPSEWIPEGYTAQSYLTELTWKGAETRFPKGISAANEKQIRYELGLIEKLQFADYFLTIWEIVEFAKRERILCQGRGSAANSSVCYVLGITAVDPVQMNLLFERFISEERGEPPDIDVDFEHERREEVIQHIYEKYGRHRAAMVSAVRTYQSRSAIREVTKVFGKEMDKRSFKKALEENPSESLQLQSRLIEELKGFPRHLSIHSGGFTLSANPILETVPVEPARMEKRTIVQWDKYDLDAIGLLKVDVLALGMLTTLRKTMDLVNKDLELYTIPVEDPKTYEMIRRADTVGTFQIESRAQMSMLPRLLPRTFYDLVVEVALVRPGPIVGKMVHPYLKRRKGLEPVNLPDPRLEPILRRTLGVPIFQEQVMKMAITLAEFTPGEADQLRRAIGAWRSSGSIDVMGKRLMDGLLKNGIPKDFADLIFAQIQGFSEYGFPESHAASFALLAYISAYLKCHHPAEFLCGLLNSQPLGFYAPHTLIDDAKRHEVKVLPLNPNQSDWDCVLINQKVRLGFRYVIGIQKSEVDLLLKERMVKPFQSLEDFLERCHLKKTAVHRLALGDAFLGFGYSQREALWRILAFYFFKTSSAPLQLSLFPGAPSKAQPAEKALFTPLKKHEEVYADYASFGLSTRGHPMLFIREFFKQNPNRKLRQFSKITTALAKSRPHGALIQIPGMAVVVQRPPTAGGVVFATLEDETGFLDLILHKEVFEKNQELILDRCFLLVSGILQRDGLSISLIVKKRVV